MSTLNQAQRPEARFIIGRDHHGWWVVCDRLGRVGGLFCSEDAAIHFAAGECGHDPRAITRARSGDFVEIAALTDDQIEPRQPSPRR